MTNDTERFSRLRELLAELSRAKSERWRTGQEVGVQTNVERPQSDGERQVLEKIAEPGNLAELSEFIEAQSSAGLNPAAVRFYRQILARAGTPAASPPPKQRG